MSISNDMASILIPEEELQAKVRELAARLTEDYEGKNPFFIGILKGCFVFMADVMPARMISDFCRSQL